MEKITLLVWSDESLAAAEGVTAPGLRSVEISRAARLEHATLLLGRGPDLAGMVDLWVDSVDVWPKIVEQVAADAYLVTESIPQALSDTPGLLTHLTWFPKPERLTDEAFFHGWHVIHTPSSADLHPLRRGYVRNAVARTLTPGSPPVRAIVSELIEPEVYLDPARLFGSDAALKATMDELPLYADSADISSCPVWKLAR